MFATHGVGGAQDLPIPASAAITGAAAALVLSFAVLVFAWPQPRFGRALGHPFPERVAAIVNARATAVTLRTMGLVSFGYMAWAALAGPDIVTNPTFGVVYVLLWVGLVPASLLLGPIWKAVSPARGIYALVTWLSGSRSHLLDAPLPKWVGLWPAAAGLFAFVWLELVYEQATYLTPVRLWFAIYFAVLLIGATVFGEKWFARADPFEVYSTLLANLTPWGRDADGRLTLRTPLDRLSRLQPQPGLVAVISVLLGSTAYDSFSRTSTWYVFLEGSAASHQLYGTLTMWGFCLFVGITFTAAAMACKAPGVTRRHLPGQFAHALVPIIVGYVCAHYLSLLVEFGKVALIQLSDPMVNGANLLGTGNWEVTYPLSNRPTLLANTKVLAVLAGHIVGVVAAHDRAVRLLPPGRRLLGQLPMLGVMLVYTTGGLYLLFNG